MRISSKNTAFVLSEFHGTWWAYDGVLLPNPQRQVAAAARARGRRATAAAAAKNIA